MATLLWTDNFSTYTLGGTITSPWTNTARTLIANSPVLTVGGQSLGVGTTGFAAQAARTIPSSIGTWTADFYGFMPSGTGVPDPPASNAPGFVGANGGPGTDGVFLLIGGAGSVLVSTPSRVGTWMTGSVSLNAWHRFTLSVTMGASGSAALTIDGVKQTFSGDTRSVGGSSTINGVLAQAQFIGSSPTAEFYFDNLSIYSGIFSPNAALPFAHMIPAGLIAPAAIGLKAHRLFRDNKVLSRRKMLMGWIGD